PVRGDDRVRDPRAAWEACRRASRSSRCPIAGEMPVRRDRALPGGVRQRAHARPLHLTNHRCPGMRKYRAAPDIGAAVATARIRRATPETSHSGALRSLLAGVVTHGPVPGVGRGAPAGAAASLLTTHGGPVF